MRLPASSLRLLLAVVVPPWGTAPGARQADHPVHWSAQVTSVARGRADTARIALTARIDEPYHLYATTQPPGGPVRTVVGLVPSSDWRIHGNPVAPPPDTIPDRNFGILTQVYADSVTIGVTLVLSSGATERAHALQMTVRYQACTRDLCLAPRTDTIPVSLDTKPERSHTRE